MFRSESLTPSLQPAGFGDVEHDVVGAGVLDLDVAVGLAAAAEGERLVDVVAARGAGGRELVRDRLQALDLEAHVVDAAPCLAAVGAGGRVVLEVEDRQVDVTVAQEVAARAEVVDLAALLHAEDLDVEPRGPLDVLGGERDVLELGHGVLLVSVLPRRGVLRNDARHDAMAPTVLETVRRRPERAARRTRPMRPVYAAPR